jgi:tetratricopeptide (TPR) repeat protein
VSARLLGLVRKELIRPYAVGEDDRFRFRHALIRDAAYEGMPKRLRAELHEQHATWLDAKGDTKLIVAYHLEQAVRLRRELSQHDDATSRLAARAGGLLGDAGRRAFRRADMPAARSLLGRAVDLLPEHDTVWLDLRRLEANALWTLGEIDRADELLLEVVEAATAAHDRETEWAARLDRSQRLSMAGRPGGGDLVETATRAAVVFEELGENSGLARAHRALGLAAYRLGHYQSAEHELRRALDHADRARDETETARSADALCTALLFGPARTEEAAGLCRELLGRATGNLLLEANVAASLSGLEAMRGRFDEARSLYGRGRAIYRDLGLPMPLAGLTQVSGLVELLAGDADAAERELREGHGILTAAGAKLYLSPQSALLAEALLALGRTAEAESLVSDAETWLGPEDLASQILVKTVRAHVDLSHSEPGAALESAQRAVRVGEQTDALSLTGDAFVALGLAHARLGDRVGAETAMARALALYARKGNVAAGGRASTLLVEAIA